MRKKMVAGNWKMNLDYAQAQDLLFSLAEKFTGNVSHAVQVLVCPPALYLEVANDVLIETGIYTGAQNLSEHASGAYTGEISAAMIKTTGGTHVIVGHSERRTYYHETDPLIAKKIRQALDNGLTPIYCCGELLDEREAGNHFDVVKTQVELALFDLPAEEMAKVIVAYEPVWAIGTGRTATPDQAQEMHKHIRGLIAAKFGNKTADDLTILYGGSCNAGNAKDLFIRPDVDGGLIGGASLKADDFFAIANSFPV